MSSSFLVWDQGLYKDGVCKLGSLKGVPDTFEIHDGVSRLAGWPADASAPMHPRFPKDIGFADCLRGTGFLVISAKARQVLEGAGVGKPEKIEYLPVKIINHKGRVEQVEYFIANPLDIVDCIDVEASVVKMDPINKSTITSAERLVLREQAIPPELKVFRLGKWPCTVIVQSKLADTMKAAGLTLLNFRDPLVYTG
jgi:hypothetical protein